VARRTKPKKAPISPRKLPRQERALATVDVILEATAHVLRTIGYDALTTNKVASAAGVSVGSLYQYFPNKDALVMALMLRVSEKRQAGFLAALGHMAAAPIADVIEVVVETLLEAHAADPRLSEVLMNQVPRVGELADVMAYNEEKISKPLHAFLLSRREDLAVDDLRAATFLLTHSVPPLLQRLTMSRPSPEQRRAIFRELNGMLVGYLTGQRPRRSR
jgi:AcrR family transcriptional regulator